MNRCYRITLSICLALTAFTVQAEGEPFFRYEHELDPAVLVDLVSPFLKGDRDGFMSTAELDPLVKLKPYYKDGTFRIQLRDNTGRFWRGAYRPVRFETHDSQTGKMTTVEAKSQLEVLEVAPGVVMSWSQHGASIFDADSGTWKSASFWPDGDERAKPVNTSWALLPGNQVLAWPSSKVGLPGAGFILWDGDGWERQEKFHHFSIQRAQHIRFISEKQFVVFGSDGVWWKKIGEAEILLPLDASVEAPTARSLSSEYRTVPVFQPSPNDFSRPVAFFSHKGFGEIRASGNIWWLLEFGDDQQLRTRFYESLPRTVPVGSDRYPFEIHVAHGFRWFVPGQSESLYGYAPGRLRHLDLRVHGYMMGVASDERVYLKGNHGYFSIGVGVESEDEDKRNGPPAKIVSVPWPKRENGQAYPNGRDGLQVDRQIWIDQGGIPRRNLEFPNGHDQDDSYMVRPVGIFGRPSHSWTNGRWQRQWSHPPRFIPWPRSYVDDGPPPAKLSLMQDAARKLIQGKIEELEADLVANRLAILKLLGTPEDSIDTGRGLFERISPSTLWFRSRTKERHISWMIDAQGCHKLEGLGDMSAARPAGDLIWFQKKKQPIWLAFKPANDEVGSWKQVHRLEGTLDYHKQFRFAQDEEQVWWKVPQSGHFFDHRRYWDPWVRLTAFPKPDLGDAEGWRKVPVDVDRAGWFYVIDKNTRTLEARRGDEILKLPLLDTVPRSNLNSNRLYVGRSPKADMMVIAYWQCLIFATPPDHADSPWEKIAVQIRGISGSPIGFDRDGNFWLAPDDHARSDYMIPAEEFDSLVGNLHRR